MAKKSRFYSITLQNGRGTWTPAPVPAPSKDHAACYFESQNIKAIEKKYLGQFEVLAQPTPYDGVVFYATVGISKLEFTDQSIGYKYLTEVFLKQYVEGVNYLNYELGDLA